MSNLTPSEKHPIMAENAQSDKCENQQQEGFERKRIVPHLPEPINPLKLYHNAPRSDFLRS